MCAAVRRRMLLAAGKRAIIGSDAIDALLSSHILMSLWARTSRGHAPLVHVPHKSCYVFSGVILRGEGGSRTGVSV